MHTSICINIFNEAASVGWVGCSAETKIAGDTAGVSMMFIPWLNDMAPFLDIYSYICEDIRVLLA